jgi:5'-deoxynucleotidase YfbR-like HD superfamily hydrolase
MTSRRLMFSPWLRGASQPRWSKIWVTDPDSVAEHTFYVTFYARQIAILIGWDGDLAGLVYRALTDDLEEVFTGDICGPVKANFVDDVRLKAYVKRRMEDDMPFVLTELAEDREAHGEQEADEINRIVKAADQLDALLFLQRELLRGNQTVEPSFKDAWNKFEGGWFNLPAGKETLARLWDTTIVPAVNDHQKALRF